ADQVDCPVRLKPCPFMLGQHFHRLVGDPIVSRIRRVVAFLRQISPGVAGLAVWPRSYHHGQEQRECCEPCNRSVPKQTSSGNDSPVAPQFEENNSNWRVESVIGSVSVCECSRGCTSRRC